VVISAEIVVREEDKFLLIKVKDTGIGIPYQDQDKLFKLFGFVQSTESVNKNGVGLGLVISERIVKQLGGSIGFSSKPAPEEGHGSEFSFSLKLDQIE